MTIKYNIEISNETIQMNFKRLTNQIYKLLPYREENLEWKKPLQTLIIEIGGLGRLTNEDKVFSLLCKLEGLYLLDGEDDFMAFRRTIFECLSIVGEVKNKCLD